MIRAVLFFVGMKIVELSGILFLPYLLGEWQLLTHLFFPEQIKNGRPYLEIWVDGLAEFVGAMGFIGLIGVTFYFIYILIKANWRFAKRKAGI